ncbi:MAG TPA: hypothetical protein VM869_15990 [Enhygromyxa sp.]|nr:hypothetical protein [Enhygromyxa sp.]
MGRSAGQQREAERRDPTHVDRDVLGCRIMGLLLGVAEVDEPRGLAEHRHRVQRNVPMNNAPTVQRVNARDHVEQDLARASPAHGPFGRQRREIDASFRQHVIGGAIVGGAIVEQRLHIGMFDSCQRAGRGNEALRGRAITNPMSCQNPDVNLAIQPTIPAALHRSAGQRARELVAPAQERFE